MVEDGQGYERILRLVSVDDWDNDLSTFAPANARPFDPETDLGDGWVDHRNYAAPTIATPYLLRAESGIPGTPVRGTVPSLEIPGWTNWVVSFDSQLTQVSREIPVYQVVSLTAPTPSLPSSSPSSYNFSTDTWTASVGWIRDYPSYNPATQKILCTIGTFYNYRDVRGTNLGSVVRWSAARTCNTSPDLNLIFRRSVNRPSTPPRGPDLPPSGWVDLVDDLDAADPTPVRLSLIHI